MKKQLIALIDCSAFYCSCERVFLPKLRNEPVVVLSNNDGCIISLTPEAKELGFKMGTPYFQIKDELNKKGVAVFSSNYCLYADMSRRVVGLLERFSDEVEQYSIDEAFIRLYGDTNDIQRSRSKLENLALQIHRAVLKGTGIPVRVSIAETKTLAKIGSDYTKMLMKKGIEPAVCFWEHPDKDEFMKQLPIEDVWGVGRQWSKKLRNKQIDNPWKLKQSNAEAMRKDFNVVMAKTIYELNGIPCFPLELEPEKRKSLVRSRMFSEKLNDPKLISQAVSTHLMRACEKLRKEQLIAGSLTVFITTGKHAQSLRYGHATAPITHKTNDSFILNSLALHLFNECYVKYDRHGDEYRYSKVGVIFGDLAPDSPRQQTLLEIEQKENPHIMQMLDHLNKRFGRHSIVLASQGLPDRLRRIEMGKVGASEWGMKRAMMSKRFTTVMDELWKVKL